MEQIIHKLDKDSRYQIAINYVNCKFSQEMQECNKLADEIANNLIHKFHNINESLHKEKFDSLCNLMSKMNYSTNFFNNDERVYGEVMLNLNYGSNSHSRGIPFRIYEKNKFSFSKNEHDYIYFTNSSNSNSKVTYSQLIHNNASDEFFVLEKQYKLLNEHTHKAFNQCYELLKKVRTAELLLKHWSEAYKYLPDDMEVLEPNSLTMSDKFKLL